MEKDGAGSYVLGLVARCVRSLLAPVRVIRYKSLYPLTFRMDRAFDIEVYAHDENVLRGHPNPLNRRGKKVFSQNEEDGITYEIIRRLGIRTGVFAEFGVGDGLENNTVVLALLGWKGFWVGGQKLIVNLPPEPEAGQQRQFAYLRRFVNRDNIVAFAKKGLELISETEVDVISLDLDGNDVYFVEELLGHGFLPKLFIVEYNAKFMPPIRWKMAYNGNHIWDEDDYFGGSLMEFNDLFERFGYLLVCCNAVTGSNAFFVHSSCRQAFCDIPQDINLLWVAPRYHPVKCGHPVSPRTVSQILADIASVRRERERECHAEAVMSSGVRSSG